MLSSKYHSKPRKEPARKPECRIHHSAHPFVWAYVQRLSVTEIKPMDRVAALKTSMIKNFSAFEAPLYTCLSTSDRVRNFHLQCVEIRANVLPRCWRQLDSTTETCITALLIARTAGRPFLEFSGFHFAKVTSGGPGVVWAKNRLFIALCDAILH